MSIYTRPVLLLLSGLLLLTLSIAALNTLVPLWLAREQMATWQVGMVSSSYFAGNLLGTLIAGHCIQRLGFNRSYYVASLIFAVGCLGLGIMGGFVSWFIWRFVAGIGCAIVWVTVESALMCSGTSRNRGRLLAAYMMVYYCGTVAGQLLLTKLPTEIANVLPWAVALVLCSILPLLFTRIVNQQQRPQQASHMWLMLRLRKSRLGVHGCVISGIVLGSMYGLMPLYLNHMGMEDGSVGFWMALLISAGILGQWPIGKLADRYGRLMVLRVQVFAVIIGSLAMLMNAALVPSLFVLGAAGFTLYPVAMAWACEKVAQHQLVAMNQALLLSYTVGSLVGPSLTSMLMERFSDGLLFVMIASVSLVYLMMLLKKGQRHSRPVAPI